MSKKPGKMDLAKFREVHQEQREQAKKGPEGHTVVARAVVRLVEDQLKEARVGEYTIHCEVRGIKRLNEEVKWQSN
jgi:hypothetical protein